MQDVLERLKARLTTPEPSSDEGSGDPDRIRALFEPTAAETAQEIASRALSGAAGVGTNLLRSAAIVGHKVQGALGLETHPIEESAYSQAAEGVEGALQEAVPRPNVHRESTAGDVAEAVGSGAAFIGAQALLPVGPAAGAAMLGVATNGPQGYYDAKRHGASDEDAWTSYALNAGAGVSEALGIGKILARVNRAAGGALQHTLLEGAEEWSQEVGQQIVGNVIAGELYDHEREALQGAVEAGTAGGLAGVILSALGSGVARGVRVDARSDPVGADASQEGQEAALPAEPIRTTEELTGQVAPELPPVERSLVQPGADEAVQVTDAEVTAKGRQSDGEVTAELPRGGPEVSGPPRTEGEPSGAPGELAEPVSPSPDPASPADSASGLKTTGTKNRTVDAELEAMGLPPAERGAKRTDEEVYGKAKAAFEADPDAGRRLVDTLAESQRPATDDEVALLTFEANRRVLERDAAEEAFNLDPSPENSARIDRAKADYAKLADVTAQSGTESGRAFRLRRMMIARDYSLAAMERAVQVAKGGEPLTKEESAKVKELHAQIADLEKKLVDAESAAAVRAAEAQADRALARIKRRAAPRARAREQKIVASRQRSDEIFRRIVARASSARSNFDPELLADVAAFAAEQVRLGFHKVSAQAEEIIARFGEEIRPHVQAAWKAAVATRRDELGSKIKARIEDGEKITDLRTYVQDIAEQFVAEGVTERDALRDAVHEVLKPIVPGITPEQTRDAISGYGDFRPLSADDVKRTLRDLKGQMQAIAKIEALEKKLAPLRSGPERRAPSDEERRLTKRVNELRKQAGIKSTAPEVQTRTTLDAIKARLTNQIRDLQHQIDTKQRIVRDRAPSPSDAETKRLEAERDVLRAQFDAIFPKTPMSDEQRIAVATKAVEASIADIERQLAGGAPNVPGKGPTNEALDALRARRKALRAELDELRAPPLDANADAAKKDAARLRAQATRLANEEARIRQRITFQEFDAAPKAEPVADPSTIEARAALETARLQFAREKRRHELRNRTRRQKVIDAAAEVLKLPKALWSSFDVSAVGRQGAFFSAQDLFFRPIDFTTRVARMFRALASEEYSGRVNAKIQADPAYPILKSGGMQFTGVDELSAREEVFKSELSDKIPGIRMSNRAFTTYLNLLRLEHGKRLLRASDGSPAAARAIAGMVNVGTGRGNVGRGKFARAVESSGAVLWAPSLYVSRFQLLFGQPLYGGNAQTRMLFAREYATTLAAAGAFYSLAALYNLTTDDEDDKATVSLDPTSPDFGKVRVGDTRIDPLAGISQATRVVARIGQSALQSLRGEKPKDDAAQVAIQFLRTKVSPSISVPYALVTEKDLAFGRAKPRSDTLKEMAIPLSFRDISEAMEDQGVPKGIALGLLATFGMGLQTYGDRESKAPKDDPEKRRAKAVASDQ